MHELVELLQKSLAAGLKRTSLTKPSEWACRYRIMGAPYPGPWNFKHHPWLKAPHDSEAQMNVVQKSAQMGFSETLLNLTFFHIDIKRVDCLYVLPSKTPDAGDFSAGRFDPALELSPHISNLFSDVKNIGHKRSGSTNLYVRGSRSRGGLKSIPVGFIALDEVEEFTQSNIPLAWERASGQTYKQYWAISTPTVENRGINALYQNSTQEKFFFPCPACSRRTELIFPDCIVITADNPTDPKLKDSYYICRECKNKLHHETKPDWLALGNWVAAHPQLDDRGFHINQMYSCVIAPHELAASHLRSFTNQADAQEFNNSKLGLTYVAEGSQVKDKDLDDARKGYTRNDPVQRGVLTMGVDVGNWLHVVISSWTIPPRIKGIDINVLSHPRLVRFLKLRTFEELDLLMYQFRVNYAVIDANPDKRKALEFANRFPKLVRLCYYGRGVSGKNIHIHKDDPAITVDRTSWLDLTIGRLVSRPQRIDLPQDIDLEYREHMKSPARIYEKDPDGNPIARYVNISDDHYCHAQNYSEIALPLAMSVGRSEDIISSIL